jgi:hypothetical protein
MFLSRFGLSCGMKELRRSLKDVGAPAFLGSSLLQSVLGFPRANGNCTVVAGGASFGPSRQRQLNILPKQGRHSQYCGGWTIDWCARLVSWTAAFLRHSLPESCGEREVTPHFPSSPKKPLGNSLQRVLFWSTVAGGSYQQNLCKTLCKMMPSRLKSPSHACGNSRLHTR